MLCVHCKALDADVLYIEHGQYYFVCSPLCLEGFFDERRAQSERIATETAKVGGGSVGTPTTMLRVRRIP
jgi:hypothetical protein